MNLTETPGEYLFSGGEYGNGQIYVSVHDATLYLSIGLNHVANICIIVRDKAEMVTLGFIAGGGRPTP